MTDVSDFPIIHKPSKHPLYPIYCGIKNRCYNKKAHAYSRYGGRGILVCDRWKNSFHAFVRDIGPRPSTEYSIERIDNNLGYSPENCVWGSKLQQSRNRSNNVMITHEGKRMCLTEWADHLNMPKSLLHCRNQRKMSVEDIFKKAKGRTIKRGWVVDGVLMPYHVLEEKHGVCRHALRNRHVDGWTLEKATTTPVRSATEGWEIDGRFYSCSELSEKWKIKKATLCWRFRKGWTAEEAEFPAIDKYRKKNAFNEQRHF